MATSFTILPFFTLISLALLCPASCSSNNTDYNSLLAFRNAVNDPSDALNSWNETTPFCNWTGIRCSRRHPNRVVTIDLDSKALVGSLSPSIGNFSFLRVINLANNVFHGVIPSEIGRLRRLEFVEFANNSFGGEIPINLTQCSNLLHLDLLHNQLYGAIPPELGFLKKIERLALSKNNLSGIIPPSMGNLTSLVLLYIGKCNLVGEIPESLGQLTNLIKIGLASNSLSGTIPSNLYNISTITTFFLGDNHLHGSIPSTVGLTLPELIIFSVWGNQFSGGIPTSLSNASSLLTVDLSINNFNGRAPMLGRLSHLRFLSMAFIPIQDDIDFILSPLVNCTKLEILQVGDSLSVTGVLPNSIANLSSLISMLIVKNTQVHGTIPSSVENLVGLAHFSLSGNNLEGSIPMSIGKLSNLHMLDLSWNKFTGEIPYSSGNLTKLNQIDFGNNQLSGSIPKSLNHCTSLLSLDLSSNNLGGAIPPEIMTLSSLSVILNLSANVLTSSLPVEIHSLVHLSVLDLSNNRLFGVIPNSLSGCTSLEQLFLDGNLFEGDIPRGLGALKGLQNFDLSQNHFSGLIPSFLGELLLERLNLSFNRLRGEVPISGVFANQSAISVDGNEDLCGGIPELKLPSCHFPPSSKKKMPTFLKALIPMGALLLLCLVIFLYKRSKPVEELPSLPTFSPPQLWRLSYTDLRKATNAFSETNLVGAGRFASVYKGVLNDGHTPIAVKVLNIHVQGASKAFSKECDVLTQIRHRNLLKILGICESIDFRGTSFKALVYEFKANGSLDKWLHPSTELSQESVGNFDTLDIIQRLNIATNVAHALEYLHYGTESIIVHGDLKPSNILLDHEMVACVGDFGLAKVISSITPAHENSSSIGIKGTIGYVPPEYGTSNSVSKEGDVYSFGILLLEIFTNRRPTDSLLKDHLNIHNFVISALPNGIDKIVDPHIWIGQDVNAEKAQDTIASVLSIGVTCSKQNPKDRMSMTEVVREFHKIQKCNVDI